MTDNSKNKSLSQYLSEIDKIPKPENWGISVIINPIDDTEETHESIVLPPAGYSVCVGKVNKLIIMWWKLINKKVVFSSQDGWKYLKDINSGMGYIPIGTIDETNPPKGVSGLPPHKGS